MSGASHDPESISWDVSGAEGLESAPELPRRPIAAPRSGERFGPYLVLEELGRGGMGVVLRARDDAADRDVALKVVLHELDPQLRERFAREGQITAGLRHPGIVRVHAAGEVDGRPYLAYELIEGARRVDHDWATAPLEVRVERVLRAAQALGQAHAHGIVHRDVKPQNILLDSSGRVRVSDFGLAAARDLERLTRTGAWVGTPRAMAPEQILGDEVGPTADVWALGVLLYRALTGRPAFPAETLAELTAQVTTARPTPPRALAPEVSPALEAVCLRALAREPHRRPPDAGAFADELERARSGEAMRRDLPMGWLVALAVTLLAAVLYAASRPEDPNAALRRQADALEHAARKLVESPGPLAGRRAEVAALRAQLDALRAHAPDAREVAAAGAAITAVGGLIELAEGRVETARRLAASDLGSGAIQTLLRGAVETESDLTPGESLAVDDLLRRSVPDAAFSELSAWRARALAAASATLDAAGARRALDALPRRAGARRPDLIARARLELRLGRGGAARRSLARLRAPPPRDLVVDLVWAELPELSAAEALARLSRDRITAEDIAVWPLDPRSALRRRHLADARSRLGLSRGRRGPPDLSALRLARRLTGEPIPQELLERLLDVYRLHADQPHGATLALEISSLAPESFELHRKLAQRLEGVPNPAILRPALPIFDRALALAPTQAARDAIGVLLCVALNECDQAERCIALATDLLTRVHGAPRGRLLQVRGESFERKRDLPRALADFEAALALQPRRHSKISLLKARTLEQMGRAEEAGLAALSFATSGDRSAKLTDAVRIVWTHRRRSHPDDARVAVEHLLRVAPDHSGWWARAALLRLEQQKPGVADALERAARNLARLSARHAEARALAPRAETLSARARSDGPAAIAADLRALVQRLEAIRGTNLGP